MTKICTKCGVKRELRCFARQTGGKFGRRACCQSCCTTRLRIFRRLHPNYNKLAMRRAYKRDPEKVKTRNRAYRLTTKGWAVKTWNKLNQRTINGCMPNWNNRACRYYLQKDIR